MIMKNYVVLTAMLAILTFPFNVSAEDNATNNFSASDITADFSDASSSMADMSDDMDISMDTSNVSDNLSGSSYDLSGSLSIPEGNGLEGTSTEITQPETKSDLQSYYDTFDQSVENMKNSLPTLETPSMDDLRSELTESMKANASSTLKSMVGDSFTSLGDSLFDIDGMPSMDESATETLNVHFADMKTAFDSAASESADKLESNAGLNAAASIGSLDEELSKWRSSSSYQAISSEISLSDVFGSLETQLPSQNTGTGEDVYNNNVASQNSWAASAKNNAVNSAKNKQQSSSASGNGKLKSAANQWAANKSNNPVTSGSIGKDKVTTQKASNGFSKEYNAQSKKSAAANNKNTGPSADFKKNYNNEVKKSKASTKK